VSLTRFCIGEWRSGRGSYVPTSRSLRADAGSFLPIRRRSMEHKHDFRAARFRFFACSWVDLMVYRVPVSGEDALHLFLTPLLTPFKPSLRTPQFRVACKLATSPYHAHSRHSEALAMRYACQHLFIDSSFAVALRGHSNPVSLALWDRRHPEGSSQRSISFWRRIVCSTLFLIKAVDRLSPRPGLFPDDSSL